MKSGFLIPIRSQVRKPVATSTFLLSYAKVLYNIYMLLPYVSMGFLVDRSGYAPYNAVEIFLSPISTKRSKMRQLLVTFLGYHYKCREFQAFPVFSRLYFLDSGFSRQDIILVSPAPLTGMVATVLVNSWHQVFISIS